MKKINLSGILGILGIAVIGAVQAIWQAKMDQDLMQETVRETIAQITEESEEEE